MSARQATPRRPGPAPGRRAWLAVLGLALVLLTPAAALAHGVEMSQGQGRAVWVRAAYSDGEPMSFAKMRIKNPAGKTHQVGNADARGRFAWLAEQPGQWLAVAEDGMGHHAELTVTVADEAAPADQPDQPDQGQPSAQGLAASPLWARAVWGLSAIFWLSGLVFWRKGRQAARRA